MKNIFTLLTGCALVAAHVTSAQLITTPGSFIKGDTNSFIVLNDLGITNQTAEARFENIFKFTGSRDVRLIGTDRMKINKMIVERQANAKVLLDQDLDINRSIVFSGGLIDLNGREIHLQPEAMLVNETQSSRITGSHGGFVSITVSPSSSSTVNPGNLGVVFNSYQPIGIVTIKRGHKAQFGFSMDESIERYYDIEFANNKLDHVAVRFNYFGVELNGQNEQAIKVYQSQDRGIRWKLQEKAVQNAAADIDLKEKANATSRWTLATPDALTNRKSLPSTAILRTWPNPAGSYFYVQVEGAVDDAQLQIFDVNGKLYRSSHFKQGTALKIEGLLPGVYIIKVEAKNLTKSSWVIVQDTGPNQIPNLLKTPSKKL
jgi:hypothetical protein